MNVMHAMRIFYTSSSHKTTETEDADQADGRPRETQHTPETGLSPTEFQGVAGAAALHLFALPGQPRTRSADVTGNRHLVSVPSAWHMASGIFVSSLLDRHPGHPS